MKNIRLFLIIASLFTICSLYSCVQSINQTSKKGNNYVVMKGDTLIAYQDSSIATSTHK